MRIGVITFPGSLDDRDAQRAVRLAGGEPVALWHGSHDLEGVDALILPGGFSYGDYLRCGAIASLSPIMTEVVDAANARHARARHLQRLPDAHRGAACSRAGSSATTTARSSAATRCSRVENASTDWTGEFEAGQQITIPLKNGEGGFIASDDTLDRLEGEGRVVFRYVDVNPNGSLRDIAGISNERGNVVGLMPHPEHAVEPGFGPDTAAAMRSGVDGLGFFTSVVQRALVEAYGAHPAGRTCHASSLLGDRDDSMAPCRQRSDAAGGGGVSGSGSSALIASAAVVPPPRRRRVLRDGSPSQARRSRPPSSWSRSSRRSPRSR